MTPLEKQEQFKTELKQLLKKYNAEICMENTGEAYFADYNIVVDFIYDEKLYTENETGIIPQLLLGKYENGD